MTETKPEEPKPVPAQDAVEKDSHQEVDEAADKFETVGAKNHHVEKIKKNYSKPVGFSSFTFSQLLRRISENEPSPGHRRIIS